MLQGKIQLGSQTRPRKAKYSLNSVVHDGHERPCLEDMSSMTHKDSDPNGQLRDFEDNICP